MHHARLGPTHEVRALRKPPRAHREPGDEVELSRLIEPDRGRLVLDQRALDRGHVAARPGVARVAREHDLAMRLVRVIEKGPERHKLSGRGPRDRSQLVDLILSYGKGRPERRNPQPVGDGLPQPHLERVLAFGVHAHDAEVGDAALVKGLGVLDVEEQIGIVAVEGRRSSLLQESTKCCALSGTPSLQCTSLRSSKV